MGRLSKVCLETMNTLIVLVGVEIHRKKEAGEPIDEYGRGTRGVG